MTAEMKAFLLALAELMEEHGVSEMSVEEVSRGYGMEVEGVEFTIEGQYEEGRLTRPHSYHTVGRYETPETLRKLAAEDL
jgi:hypothetical protein